MKFLQTFLQEIFQKYLQKTCTKFSSKRKFCRNSCIFFLSNIKFVYNFNEIIFFGSEFCIGQAGRFVRERADAVPADQTGAAALTDESQVSARLVRQIRGLERASDC